MPSGPNFGDELESKTDAYFEPLTDCVSLLPTLLDQYVADEAYEETFDRIQALESECDRINREITSSFANAGPQEMGLLNTRVHFNTSDLIAFYQKLDVVANLTERIAQELLMIQPAHDNDCFRGLQEMAEQAASGMAPLEDVVERFVHSLRETNGSETLTDEIDAVRAMESACDEIRNNVIETAFADDSIDQPLMYREFAILFDRLANTMEDLTDQIIIIASNEPGIVTEVFSDSETQ